MSETVVEKSLVPKLRFPEFNGKWTVRTLDDEGELIRGLTYSADNVREIGLPVLRSSNIQNGRLVLDDDIVHVEVECTPNMRLRPHDMVICMSNGSKVLVGKNAEYESNENVIRTVGAFCAIFRTSNSYARLLLSTPRYRTYVGEAIAGGNINNLTPSQVGSFAFPFPSNGMEQRKIAECLQSLDGLIAAETEKLEALKRHKKGLLQQLFAIEGETIPRLRFPQFCNSGEWQELRLGDVCTLISGQHLEPHQYSNSGGLPYFSGPSDLTNDICQVRKWVNVSNNTGTCGDILVTVKGSGAGGVWMSLLEKVAMGRQLMAVHATGCDSGFAYQYLLTRVGRLEAMATGNLIPGLARPDLLTLSFPLPTREEQIAVSLSLRAVDDEIGHVAYLINQLGSHKAALMQQLFPSIEEFE